MTPPGEPDPAASLDGKTFRSASNTEGGEVDSDTTFRYRQDGETIWAEYSGGSIRLGFLVGTRTGTTLEFRYSHLNTDGRTASGRCTSTVTVDPTGRLRLEEDWAWESQPGTGRSAVVEAD